MTRTQTMSAIGFALFFSAGGCEREPASPGGEILTHFQEGVSRQSVLDALPDGGLPDDPFGVEEPVVKGYRVDRYFTAGMSIEVVWLHDVEAGAPEGDYRRTLTPVLFVYDVLDGWGWSHFDQRSEEWGIAPPSEPEEPEEPAPDLEHEAEERHENRTTDA